MASESNVRVERPRKFWVLIGGIVAGVVLLGVIAFLVWDSRVEHARKTRAEHAIHAALSQWCSTEDIDDLKETHLGDFFGEFMARTKWSPRPTSYQISSFARAKPNVYEVVANLTFPGGPEIRRLEVEVSPQSGKCSIVVTSSEDVSNSESHARAILQAWLDGWVAGEKPAAFMPRHPEVHPELSADVPREILTSDGARLVRYEFTNSTPGPEGYRFTITAVIEHRRTPKERILRYDVSKKKTVGGGRWLIFGT